VARRPTGFVLLGLAALAAFLLSIQGVASASTLDVSAEDEAQLAEGRTVSYPQTVARRGRRYVGGVSYAVVHASVPELIEVFRDISAYREVLPYARAARLVGNVGSDQLIEISQGTAFVEAVYTLRMHMDADQRRVRFWLDPGRPHGLDDAWGYFKVDPLPDADDGSPRVLLSYGILVDLGPGLMRDFFEGRIQASMLAIPDRLQRYAAARFRSHHRA
jgi:hypothetical protein